MYGVPPMKLSKKVSKVLRCSKVQVCFNSNRVVARLLIFSGAKFKILEVKYLAISLILLNGKNGFHLNRGNNLVLSQ